MKNAPTERPAFFIFIPLFLALAFGGGWYVFSVQPPRTILKYDILYPRDWTGDREETGEEIVRILEARLDRVPEYADADVELRNAEEILVHLPCKIFFVTFRDRFREWLAARGTLEFFAAPGRSVSDGIAEPGLGSTSREYDCELPPDIVTDYFDAGPTVFVTVPRLAGKGDIKSIRWCDKGPTVGSDWKFEVAFSPPAAKRFGESIDRVMKSGQWFRYAVVIDGRVVALPSVAPDDAAQGFKGFVTIWNDTHAMNADQLRALVETDSLPVPIGTRAPGRGRIYSSSHGHMYYGEGRASEVVPASGRTDSGK